MLTLPRFFRLCNPLPFHILQKEQSQKIFNQASKDLDEARKAEKELAALISDDHVTADRRGKRIQDCFPKIQVGMMISKVNHVDTEELAYDDIFEQIELANRPHVVEFRRYDYAQNVISGRWDSLQELRIQGMFVEDPRVKREAFVEAVSVDKQHPLPQKYPRLSNGSRFARRQGRHGDIAELKNSLAKGEDVDCVDAAGATAFFAAVSNGHFKAMTLLAANGANLNHRDRNFETPLLAACRRGRQDVVTWLLSGVEVVAVNTDAPMTVEVPPDDSAPRLSRIPVSLDAKDRNHRTAVMHAIMGGNVQLTRQLVELRTALTIRDKTWGTSIEKELAIRLP